MSPRGPLRVMHLLYILAMGGMEEGVVKLANAHDRRRVRVSICSSKPADQIKERLDPSVPLFEMNRRDGNDPGFVLALTRLLRRERPDILHTHSWGTLFEGLVAGRLAGVPFIVHGEHGTIESKPRNIRLQRWAWHRVDQVLSVSSRLAERLSQQVGFPLEQIRTVRNGVDLSRFGRVSCAEARAALELRPDQVVVGTVGRLVPVKDHVTLLKAWALVRQSGADGVLLITGDGPMLGRLQELARELGVAPTVRFLGLRTDVDRVFSALDVFVLSSTSEGMSNTLVEAMASRLPVVATRVGGADEVVDDARTGILVPASSPGELARGLQLLMADPVKRKDLGAAGRDRAERLFGLDQMVAGYERVYLDLMQTAR